jgi:hypothetical protein
MATRSSDLSLMERAGRTFGVGGISLSLTGPIVWTEPFAHSWASWIEESPGWEVRLVQDGTLPEPQGPFFGARPRFAGGCCLLESPGFAGEIAPEDGTALLRAHPKAEAGDLAYFVRTVFALRAFEEGALLFHAAGIVHRGAAYAFFGHSGSGKTTASRLSPGKPVLRALLRLVQAPEERLEPMPRGAALGELAANSPVVNADPVRSAALLVRWEGILRSVPIYFLHFRKSEAFWEVLDARLD